MRITRLRTTPVAVPFQRPEAWAYGVRTGMVSVLLELETDEGVVGLGEAAAYPSAEIVQAAFGAVEPHVLGESAFDTERIRKRITVTGTWHHVQATSPAIAAVEMACWDAVGKACGQPLVNLFGGRVREKVEYFYYLARQEPGAMAEDAARGRERGFTTFYLKVGSDDPSADVARVEAVRGGAGPDARIRVDANEAWTPATAARVLAEMDRFDLELAEQPVSGRDLPEMARLRARVDVPLLANEASWTRQQQLRVIQHGAADALSVDNQMDDGLASLKASAAMCEVAGLPVLKHSLGELGPATYAGAHVLASAPNVLHASQAYGSLLADDVLAGVGPLAYVDGCLTVPDAPGIGVELDRDKVGTYAEAYAADPAGSAFTEDPAPAESSASTERGKRSPTPVLPKL